MRTWRRYDSHRKGLIETELRRIFATKGLSRDTTEMVARILGVSSPKGSVRRKTLLVTGASAGTGAATAQAAAAESYDTAIINYRSDRASADTVAQMVNAQGCEAVVIRADITDPAALSPAMFEQITALPPCGFKPR